MQNKLVTSNTNLVNADTFNEYLENTWYDIGDVRKLKIDNKMLRREWDDPTKIPELIVETCFNPAYMHFFCKYFLNIEVLPYQFPVLQVLWTTPLPLIVATRGFSKSWLLAVYICMRMVLHQGCRIAVVGSSLRQSMVIFNYIEQIWENAPILQDICGGKKCGPKKEMHMATWTVGHSRAIFLPLGDGTRIRGQRANIVIAEEFASISEAIFEVVVRGFAATKSQGVVESYKLKAKERAMRESGLSDTITKNEAYQIVLPHIMSSNQIVINGTANYQFNHFYKYYNTYKSIITSGGDVKKLKESFPDMPFDANLDARDYAIVRVPYDVVPEGPMDEKILSQGRATMDPILFDMEYGAVFPADSDGFYLASWLHSATCPVKHNGETIRFAPMLSCQTKPCIMAIDPASEDDNFAIAIVSMDEGYRSLLYMWTTNHKRFEELKRKGLIDADVNDYVTFCLKHIRALIRRFNIHLIVLDKAGGGVTVREGLKDTARLEEGDEVILDMDDENERNQKGLHILKLAEFSSDEWRKESHYGLRKDIIDKVLIFPEYDLAEIELLALEKSDGYETLDDCYHEIEECKTETALIKHSQTPNGTERWDVPEIVGLTAEQTRKKLKRDRFTALLMANWGARIIATVGPKYSSPIGTMVKRGRQATFTTNTPQAIPQCRTLPNGRRIYC